MARLRAPVKVSCEQELDLKDKKVKIKGVQCAKPLAQAPPLFLFSIFFADFHHKWRQKTTCNAGVQYYYKKTHKINRLDGNLVQDLDFPKHHQKAQIWRQNHNNGKQSLAVSIF